MATFGYDRAKRPLSLDKGSLAFDQAYDRDGNVTSESRSLPAVSGDAGSGTQAFAYDALNRLTGSSGLASGSRSYTYDLDGNRVSKTEGGVTSAYVYDRTDQLVSVQPAGGPATVFGSDAYGNVTTNAESISSVTTMTYDLADKLGSINGPGTANDARFTFDALGRFRTRELGPIGTPSSTDTYSYAGTAETVLRISNSAGPTVTDSIVSPAGDRLGVRQSGTLNWFVPDLHGNVAASLDATEATVVAATRYDAYGQSIATGSAGGTAVGAANWKYQGRLDVSPAGLATPLYDMSARFYSPGLGTFTSLDSVMGSAQNPLSMNRFLYALANPATLIDPTGHFSVGQMCPYGPEDCALIDWTPPAGMTDGVSPLGPKPKPKPKDETTTTGCKVTGDCLSTGDAVSDELAASIKKFLATGEMEHKCSADEPICRPSLQSILDEASEGRPTIDGVKLVIHFVMGVVKGAAIAVLCAATGTAACVVLGLVATSAAVLSGADLVPDDEYEWAEFVGGLAGAGTTAAALRTLPAPALTGDEAASAAANAAYDNLFGLRSMPAASAGAVDRQTGLVYLGRSSQDLGTVHPELARILPKDSVMPWPVTNCAEVAACNAALKAGAKLDDLTVVTLGERQGTVTVIPPCGNCVKWVPTN